VVDAGGMEVLNFANSVWWLIIAKSVPAFQWKEEIFCCYFAAVEEEAEEEEEVEEAEDTFLEEAVVMETISGSL